MKYLLALGFLGTAMGQTANYVFVDEGYREDYHQGYPVLTYDNDGNGADAAACAEFCKNDATPAPGGSIVGFLHLWNYNPKTCYCTYIKYSDSTAPILGEDFYNTYEFTEDPPAQTDTPGSCDPSTCTGCTPADYINAQCCNCA